MKLLAITSFGITTGILSAFSGITFMSEPVKYLLINIPALVCFIALSELIDKR